MNAFKGYEKIVPAARSSNEARRNWRKRILVVTMCSTVLVAAVICVAIGTVHLKTNEGGKQGFNGAKPSATILKACNNALYRKLCISSLSSYPGALQTNLTGLAVIAVKLSLDQAKQVYEYTIIESRKAVDKRERAALGDCVQQFEDTVEQLNTSLSELKRLNSKTWKKQIGDLQTFLSAALTNPSTCVDGLEEESSGNLEPILKQKSENATEFISNALAVVNNLSTPVKGDMGKGFKSPLPNRRLLFVTSRFPFRGEDALH